MSSPSSRRSSRSSRARATRSRRRPQAWDGEPLQTIVKNTPAARDRRAHRDHRAHHQRRAAAVPDRDRARERVLQPLSAGRGRAAPSCCRSAARSTASSSTASATPSALALRFAAPHPPAPSTRPPRERWIDVYGPLSAARQACSAPRPAAPKRTSSASRDLRPPRLQRADRDAHLQAALAVWRYSPTPPAGSSATRSATPPPTRSGHSPKTGQPE